METIPVNIAEEVLKEFGIDYEDLNAAERETFQSKYFDLKKISVGDIKTYISRIKNALILQLCDTEGSDIKDGILKARLKNYVLLEMFLLTPERAEEALRKNLEAQKKKRKFS